MYDLEPQRGVPTDGDHSLIERYRRYYREQGAFVEKPSATEHPATHLRLELPDGAGSGWTELVLMDRGLGVGMCDYELFRPLHGECLDIRTTIGFSLLLSGEFEVAVPDAGIWETIRGGELWLCRNFAECARYFQPSAKVIRGLSIELPRLMVESWLSDCRCGMSRTLELLLRGSGPAPAPFGRGMRPLVRCPRRTAPLVRAAGKLLIARRDSVCARLHFESLALDLLAQLLAFDYPDQDHAARRASPAIDSALDILRAEWADPPTISALARRVGLNECYLKADFRRRTGQSIGEYVRSLRMEHALEMIESGTSSVLETALSVGYSNPSHFSAAFKRFHGRLPSAYAPRA